MSSTVRAFAARAIRPATVVALLLAGPAFAENCLVQKFSGSGSGVAPDGTSSGGLFGFSFAIEGDHCIVGDQWESFVNNSGMLFGAIYFFERSGSAWSETQRFGFPTMELPSDAIFVGWSVDMDGDTAVAGSRRSGTSGYAYVFERQPPGRWSLVRTLQSSDPESSDWFSVKVAVCGDTIAVGARVDDGATEQAGVIHIFERDHGGADAWGRRAELLVPASPDTPLINDLAIAMNDEWLFANRDVVQGDPDHRVWVFRRNDALADGWEQVDMIEPPIGSRPDQFGHRILAADGELYICDRGDASVGAVHMYRLDRTGDAWEHVRSLAPTPPVFNTQFGWSVDVQGDALLIGSANSSQTPGTNGVTELFTRTHALSDDWILTDALVAADLDDETDSAYGQIVAFAGDQALVGASSDGDVCYEDPACKPGALYVFDLNEACGTCAADVDGSLTVDVDDVVQVVLLFGTNDPDGDVDGNGVVDIDDVLTTILGWGPCPPEEFIGACCLDDGFCDPLQETTCVEAGGTWGGSGSTCDEYCIGGCCLPDGTCPTLAGPTCGIFGGVFAGHDQPCTGETCGGACCVLGECFQSGTAENCTAAQGVFFEGVTCEPEICVGGASCFTSCLVVASEAECHLIGGTYLGDGAVCEPTTCLAGGCCLPDGTCIDVLLEGVCTIFYFDGVYQGDGVFCSDVTCPAP